MAMLEPAMKAVVDAALRDLEASGEAEIIHLDRRGAKRKYTGASACRQPCQVDGDVDFQPAQERSHFKVALSPHIDKSIECAPESAAHFAAVVEAIGYRNGLETRAVMMLEHACHQNADRVHPQIG